MSTPQGKPPFRNYGDPLPGAVTGAPRRRWRTVALFVAAILLGLLIGLLLGLWFRDGNDPPIIPPPATTTVAPPVTPAPTQTTTAPTAATTPTTVPVDGPSTTAGGGDGSAPRPIPPDTASPLGVPTALSR